MGTLPPGDTEPRVLCKALPAQRPHHPLGALGLALLQEGPLDLQIVGLCRGEQAVHVHGGGGVGGSLPGKPSPAPSAPGQSRLGTQACSDSRDVTPAQVPKARREQSQQFSLFLKKCF